MNTPTTLSKYEQQLKKMRDRPRLICPICRAEVKTLKTHYETRKCNLKNSYNNTISTSLSS